MIEIIMITGFALVTCILAYKCVELKKAFDGLHGECKRLEASKNTWVKHTHDANNRWLESRQEADRINMELEKTKQSQEIKIVEYSSNQYSINRGDYVYSMQGEWITLEEAKKWNYNHCLYIGFDQAKIVAKAMKDNFIIVNTFNV